MIPEEVILNLLNRVDEGSMCLIFFTEKKSESVECKTSNGWMLHYLMDSRWFNRLHYVESPDGRIMDLEAMNKYPKLSKWRPRDHGVWGNQ